MDIFVKKTENPIIYDKMDIEAIMETIPKGSYKVRQPLLEHMVESRWRFIHVPFSTQNKENKETKIIKKFTEISRKRPEEEREYLDKQVNWIKTTIDPIYDKFVVDEFYCYTEN
jgi:hypothetical protein